MDVHIKSFKTTKFHEILLSGFRGVALTNCFSSIFHFGQISKFKKGVIPRKKWNQNFLWICTSTHYVLHYNKVSGNCWAVSEELRWQTVLSNIFHFGQISKFKKGVTLWKKNWIKISCGYAHLHGMSFTTTKFHEILWRGFRGVGLTRKTGQTDWLMDRSKTLYPPQLVAWGIKITFNIHVNGPYQVPKKKPGTDIGLYLIPDRIGCGSNKKKS